MYAAKTHLYATTPIGRRAHAVDCTHTAKARLIARLAATLALCSALAFIASTLANPAPVLASAADDLPIIMEETIDPQSADGFDRMYGVLLQSQAQQAVVMAAQSLPSPGTNLCASWVCDVFEAAGIPITRLPDARDYYDAFCWSNDPADLRAGMILAEDVSSAHGHIGIYIGDGLVISSETHGTDSMVVVRTVDDWVETFGPDGAACWGWADGIDLSAL